MKKLYYTAGLFFIFAISAYLYASPYVTIYLIKKVIDSRDYSRLAQYIDYDELRKNLKGKAELVAERITSNIRNDSTASGLEKSLKKKLIEQVVDQLVTPENTPVLIMQVMTDRERKPEPTTGEQTGKKNAIDNVEDLLRNAEFGYRSFNTFAIKIRTGGQRPVVFIMTRNGLQWKLTNIDF